MSTPPIQSSPPPGYLSSLLETGGQMGASLAFSCLAAAPFTGRLTKLMASGIGGWIPMLAKDCLADKQHLRGESLINVAELASGIAVSFLPSLRWMFAANIGLSLLFESVRQTAIWDRSSGRAFVSALVAGAGTAALGGLGYGIRSITWRRLGSMGSDIGAWQRVEAHFGSHFGEPGLAYLSKVRRHTSVPTDQWFYKEHRRIVTGLEQEARRMQRIVSGFTLPSQLAGQMSRLKAVSDRSTRELDWLLAIMKHYHGSQTTAGLRTVYGSNFRHEVTNRMTTAVANAEFCAEPGRNGDDLREALMDLRQNLEDLLHPLKLYREKPRFMESLGLLQEFLSGWKGDDVTIKGQLNLNREEEFRLVVGFRRLAEQTAITNGQGRSFPKMRVMLDGPRRALNLEIIGSTQKIEPRIQTEYVDPILNEISWALQTGYPRS